MNVLEKILEEIEEKFKTADADKFDCEELCDVEDWYDSGYIDGQLSAHEKCMDIIRSKMDEAKDINVPSNDGWISVDERLPEDDRYILLSFENFSIPLVGRYEENEKGGAFYLGDCDEEDTCISNDLYVNAWTYLPERYKGDSNA